MMSILLVYKIIASLLFYTGGSVLTFESIESKTQEGEIVFNEIELSSSSKSDIWFMKQSHSGPEFKDWDSIKIIVDKTSKPYKASFHQMDKKGNEKEYSVSCFRCHSNGPRLIRPKSLDSLKDKLTALKWNLLIKSYGEIKFKKNNPFKRKVQFIENSSKSKEILNVKSCTTCHYKNGPRSELTKSHILTIKHLVKRAEMPPWPYEITKEDKLKVKKFIYGF